MNIRHLLHRCLLRVVKVRPLPELQYLCHCPNVSKSAIYVANHSCMYDIPIAALAIEKHFYVLMGRQRLKLADKIFFSLNGVIWVDRKDKAERAKAHWAMNKRLSSGENILIFPEGTWNFTPSNPILPLYWGVISSARDCQVPIVPLAMDYRDGVCRIKFGKPLWVAKTEDNGKGVARLEESLSTLLWEIWESYPKVIRSKVRDDYWDVLWRQRVEEYPMLDEEYEHSCARKRI